MIREIRQLTDRPFGINLILHWPPEERLKACLEEDVPVVSFFWGDPFPYIPVVHAAGALVMQTVGSAAEARCMRDAGVDILVAQGWEAGGHVWGQVATLPLVPAWWTQSLLHRWWRQEESLMGEALLPYWLSAGQEHGWALGF
jgi:NAD(P)H-dependent flavin oxidoreductase YrpB (nitropropane dioxygenase family)